MSFCKHRVMDRCKKDDRPCIFSPDCFEPEEEKHMTNADRIRAMSDEELVDMLWKTGRNYRAVCADPVVDYNEHHEHLIDWLKQPAKGE